MIYIKQIFLALYDVSIIVFKRSIIGNSKKVSVLLYRCYNAFCGVLRLYFNGYIAKNEIKIPPAIAQKYRKIVNDSIIKNTAGVFFSDGMVIFIFYFNRQITNTTKSAINKKIVILVYLLPIIKNT